jgi:hypothetical protein
MYLDTYKTLSKECVMTMFIIRIRKFLGLTGSGSVIILTDTDPDLDPAPDPDPFINKLNFIK